MAFLLVVGEKQYVYKTAADVSDAVASVFGTTSEPVGIFNSQNGHWLKILHESGSKVSVFTFCDHVFKHDVPDSGLEAWHILAEGEVI